jgi:hypothetical protein
MEPQSRRAGSGIGAGAGIHAKRMNFSIKRDRIKPLDEIVIYTRQQKPADCDADFRQ